MRRFPVFGVVVVLCVALLCSIGLAAVSSAEETCYSDTQSCLDPRLGPIDVNTGPTTIPVDPVPEPSGGGFLPVTGSTVLDLVGLGAGLIGAGFAAVKLRKTKGDDWAPRETMLGR